MVILFFVDGFVLYVSVMHTWANGPSMIILFAFEYMILLSSIIVTIVKYFFNIYDLQMDGRWESKSVYVLYLEFFADIFQLLVYAVFFVTIWMHYGLPLHLIRQIYYSFKHFRERILGVIRYRRAISDLDSRFTNATPEDLDRAHRFCIICRDHRMTEGKKLPCGHVLHLHCLRTWFQTRQECPICRNPVGQNNNNPQQENNNPPQNNDPRNIPGFNPPANNANPLPPTDPSLNNSPLSAPSNPLVGTWNQPAGSTLQTHANTNAQINPDVSAMPAADLIAFDPLSQVRSLQEQVGMIQYQLQELAHYLRAIQEQQNALTNLSTRDTPTVPSTTRDASLVVNKSLSTTENQNSKDEDYIEES